jgi:MOSC domain-containing protein YiiM
MKIVSLNVGLPATVDYNGRRVTTGGYKQSVARALARNNQLDGDGQGDTVHHGGVDKAVNAYAFDHYAYWEGVFGGPLPTAAFSENLTLAGALEDEVCIGDVYRAGEVLLQVSQPRVPCYKLNLKHAKPHLLQWIRASGFTGFYLRILREGALEQGMSLALVERDPAEVTIADLNAIYYSRAIDTAAVERALAAPALSGAARAILNKRLNGPLFED